MARSNAVRRRYACVALVLSQTLTLVHAQTYYFSGAVQIVNGVGSSSGSGSCDTCSAGSSAVQAQCPADHPAGCGGIGAAE